jgi:hypothetical protein
LIGSPPLPFPSELVPLLSRDLGGFRWLYAGGFKVLDFGPKGDDLLFLFGMCTPSTEEEETIVFVLALIHEELGFVSLTVSFPSFGKRL